jgi:UPF0755 protein
MIRSAPAVLLAIVAGVLAAIVLLVVVYPARRGPGRGRNVEIVIGEQTRLDEVVTQLAAAGVIEHPLFFAIYARWIGADEHLRRGAVLVRDDMTPRQIVQRIAVGYGSADVEVMIPEGFDRFEVAARLERWGVCWRDELLAATRDRALLDELEIPGPSVEGYLFPDTYRLREGMRADDVVRRMVANYRRRTASLWTESAAGLERLRSDLGWGPHEVLILASIVEKEAAVRDEQAIIAGVFLNRLRNPTFVPHRLDADPTVSYGCLEMPDRIPSCAGFRGRISRAMIADAANPYNTYRREALPPGPISNPGIHAIRAVLSPAEHEYLFFVARGGGRHTFSRTIEEHNQAVARLRAAAAGAP